MNSKTLIIDAFWVDNKRFPTMQYPCQNEGRAFYDFYEGSARHLGWMDLVLLKEIVQKNQITDIILQNLSTLGKISEITHQIKVCTAYEYEHFILKVLKKNVQLEHCKPLYKTLNFGSWSFSDDDERLPAQARYYMKYLLEQTRVRSVTCMNSKIKYVVSFNKLGQVVEQYESNL